MPRTTPLTGFTFGLIISDAPLGYDYKGGTAFFRSVGGLKSDNEVTDYMEGGVTAFTRKVIGVRKYPNLVLKQGFTGDTKLFMWKWKPCRVDGWIVQLGPRADGSLKEICRWKFLRGYPVKWEGPDFDAMKNELAIETIEIAHHGLEWEGATAPAPTAQPQPTPTPPPPPQAKANFASGSDQVTGSQPELDAAAKYMEENPEKKCRVEGHTDGDGDAQTNMGLSERRATNTRAYMIQKGGKAENITSKGCGETQPIHKIPEKTAAEKLENRRTIVVWLD